MKKLAFLFLIVLTVFLVVAFQNRDSIGPLKSETQVSQRITKADSQEPGKSEAPDIWGEVRRLHSERKLADASMETILQSETGCLRGPAAIKRAREAMTKAFDAEREAYSRGSQAKGDLLTALRKDKGDKVTRRQELEDKLKTSENNLRTLQDRRQNLSETGQSAANRNSVENSIRALDKIIEQAGREVEILRRSLDNIYEVISLIDQRIENYTDQRVLQKKLIDLSQAQAYFYNTYYDVLGARLALQCPDEDDTPIFNHKLPNLGPSKKFGNSPTSDHDPIG
jgi:chromosome segregation ATPase